MKHIEDIHQEMLVKWADHTRINLLSHKAPLGSMLGNYLFAIPNGGKRNAKEAARMKAGGVRAGIPDTFLSFPVEPYHGLYIELKKPLDCKPVQRPTEKQKDKLRLFRSQGYAVCVCYGFDQAKQAMTDYMTFNFINPEDDLLDWAFKMGYSNY